MRGWKVVRKWKEHQPNIVIVGRGEKKKRTKKLEILHTTRDGESINYL